MTGKGEKEQRPGTPGQEGSATGVRRMSFDALRLRARQLSLREQLERHHFLLERLHATSTRLIQAVEQGQVFEALGEISRESDRIRRSSHFSVLRNAANFLSGVVNRSLPRNSAAVHARGRASGARRA